MERPDGKGTRAMTGLACERDGWYKTGASSV